MEVEIIEEKHDGEILYKCKLNGKESFCLFEREYEALVYAGLMASGISKNDCSYFSKYINSSLYTLKKGE